MDTNIVLHWIAHFRGQVTETRPRSNARAQGRGINITVKDTDKSNHVNLFIN